MLATRHHGTRSSLWSCNKLDNALFDPLISPSRMSNNLSPSVSSPAEWQGEYTCLPPESNVIPTASETGNPSSGLVQTQSINNGFDLLEANTNELRKSSTFRARGVEKLGQEQQQPHPSDARLGPQQDESSTAEAEIPSSRKVSVPSSETKVLVEVMTKASKSPEEKATDFPPIQSVSHNAGALKEEEEEVLDDEDMEEVEEAIGRPQTAAERMAQRRKMKRFRLTHQQTRFLMSEFAKQPHPDAAHRDRLSREIPGLSPRQVQVWFQNRRAKIKRLAADDRERMVKMRAVPDDFDNIQALHSPYGAVQGVGTPMPSPADFGNASQTEHIIQPLMVDVRRPDGEGHSSPTGLSPAFGNIGFNTQGAMTSPDILSPISASSNDNRYGGQSSHLSSPLGIGTRPALPFARQTSFDSSPVQSRGQQQQIRPLQPLQLRETLSRSRSDNLQSPLRSEMSWKGDSINYTTFSGGCTSPQTGRQRSSYEAEQGVGGVSSGSFGYDPGQSTLNINYTSYQPSSLQHTSQHRLRDRAASATFPLGLDLRNQFRPMQPSITSPGPHTPGTSRGVPFRSMTLANTPATAPYATGFPSAPLTAPINFSLPRTSATTATEDGRHTATSDYLMPQLSAPIAPSQDFSRAFRGEVGARTALQDAFGDRSDTVQELRADILGGGSDLAPVSALKRKRSFTMPANTGT